MVRFRRKADEARFGRFGKFGNGFENVRVSNELQRRRHLALLKLLRRALRRPPIGHCRGRDKGNRGIGVSIMPNCIQACRQHLPRAHHINPLHALRCLERDRSRDQHDLVSAPRRLRGDGKPHLTGRGIRQKPHRIQMLPGRACGNNNSHHDCQMFRNRQNNRTRPPSAPPRR